MNYLLNLLRINNFKYNPKIKVKMDFLRIVENHTVKFGTCNLKT